MIGLVYIIILSYLLRCQILVRSCQVWDEERLQGFNCAEESIYAQQSCGIPPVFPQLLRCLHLQLFYFF